MPPLRYDVTVLGIPTTATDVWLSRFAAFFSRDVRYGIYVRAWPELNTWLECPSSIALSPEAVAALEEGSRRIGDDVLERMIARDLTQIYCVTTVEELLAFFWSSYKHDELPLVFFPASCSKSDEAALLIAADTLGVGDYPNVDASTPWFATLNLEDRDDPLACVAVRDAKASDQLREKFPDSVIEGQSLHRYL